MLRVVQQRGSQHLVQQLLRQAGAAPAALSHLQYVGDAQPSGEASFMQCLALRYYASPAAFKAAVSNAHPISLAHSRDTGEIPDTAAIGGWKHWLLKVSGFYSRESNLYRGSKGLYQSIVEQCEDPRLREALELPDTFGSTYALMCLHVWLLLVRLRAEGEAGKDLVQVLYETFQDDVEVRVHAEGVKVRVSKWLKELEKMFYGSCESYEKALRGQEQFQSVLLRNVYGDDPAKAQAATALAHYVQRELSCLKMTPADAVMGGKIRFSRLQALANKPTGSLSTN